MNSRRKGKRGELAASHFLTDQGFPARRGQQYAGCPDAPDVVCPLLPGIHIEVKRCQKTDLYGWLAQAKHDAGAKLPVILYRRNNARWLAVLDAEDFLALVRESHDPQLMRCEFCQPETTFVPQTNEGQNNQPTGGN